MRCTTAETAEREKGEAWNRRRIKWARKRGARKELRKLFCQWTVSPQLRLDCKRGRGREGAGAGEGAAEAKKEESTHVKAPTVTRARMANSAKATKRIAVS